MLGTQALKEHWLGIEPPWAEAALHVFILHHRRTDAFKGLFQAYSCPSFASVFLLEQSFGAEVGFDEAVGCRSSSKDRQMLSLV